VRGRSGSEGRSTNGYPRIAQESGAFWGFGGRLETVWNCLGPHSCDRLEPFGSRLEAWQSADGEGELPPSDFWGWIHNLDRAPSSEYSPDHSLSACLTFLGGASNMAYSFTVISPGLTSTDHTARRFQDPFHANLVWSLQTDGTQIVCSSQSTTLKPTFEVEWTMLKGTARANTFTSLTKTAFRDGDTFQHAKISVSHLHYTVALGSI
jgi:hypothetical protein